MMKLAIIGLAQSGKSTIFNALTGSEVIPGMSGARVEVRQAMVDVPDERLTRLAEMHQSKKIVHAQISFTDVAGFSEAEQGQGLSGQFLNALSGMDGLLLVVRAFEDEAVPHPNGRVDAERDLNALMEDLLLNDLIAVERKLERLAEERQKAGRDVGDIEREKSFFVSVLEKLNEGVALRDQSIDAGERERLAGLGLLSQKALMTVVNLGEGQAGEKLDPRGVKNLGLQGRLEMELAQLSPEERKEFQAEYGIRESGVERVIREAYEILNTQSFYTVAEKEAHAWMLARGASALDAAHTIHSDIGRGFIRAEVIGADELLSLGSKAQARETGKLRLEGKTYVMQDGDIINVRFNV